MITPRRAVLAAVATVALGGAMVAQPGSAKAWCGYYGCGYGYSDGALAAGIIGGLAVGAIAASAAHQAQAAQPTRVVYVAQPRRHAPRKARVHQVRR
jgi:hypothetical protein